MKGFLSRRYVTKREVGWLFTLTGIAGILLPFLSDLLGAGAYSGIGPLQRLVLAAAILLALLGLTLIPLGDRPA